MILSLQRVSAPENMLQYSCFCSRYLDIPNEPLYPFGFGLSYTTFTYSDLQLTKHKLQMKDALNVRVTVTNTGKLPGEEVVQLYTRDLVASLTRPVKELKRFQKIKLNPGESKIISFKLFSSDLGFYNRNMEFTVESGDFKVFVGTDSKNTLEKNFELVSD